MNIFRGSLTRAATGCLFLLIVLCARGDLLARADDPLVNDPAADVTAQNSQRTTALVLGSGSNVIAAFEDEGSLADGHFTGFSLSSDGGASWVDRGSLPATDTGSPVLARDQVSGTTYLATQSGAGPQVFRSIDEGVSWSSPVNAAAGANFSGGLGVWLAVDNAPGAGQGTVYVVFNNGGVIYLSRSTDGGLTWGPSGGVQVSQSGASYPWVTVGPDHAVYVFSQQPYGPCRTCSPSNLVSMRKSTNGGMTFVGQPTVLTEPIGRSQAVANPVNGNLYFVSSRGDVQTGAGHSIAFRASTDGGQTWSLQSLNDDNTTRDHWQPVIAVTPDGSHVFVAWYDRRSDPGNSLAERWGVIGTVSGSTITWGPNFQVSSGSFPVGSVQDLGDHDQAAADNNFFYTTWTDKRLSNWDVRFARIPIAGPGAVLGYASSSLSAIDQSACNDLFVALRNRGTGTATGVSATLSTTVPGVFIDRATSAYPEIAAGSIGANSSAFRIRIGSGFACAANIDFTLTATTANDGSFTIPFRLGSALPLGPVAQFDNNTPITIPAAPSDNVPVTVESSIDVSGISTLVGRVTVSFYLTYPVDPALEVFLVSPDNTVVELTSSNGSYPDWANYGSGCSQASRTTFDDDAGLPPLSGISITNGRAPFVGTYRPEGALSVYKRRSGTAVNGTWKLRVTNKWNTFDAGTLNCWSLFVAPVICTTGSCASKSVPDDFSGDGQADLGVFDPATGTWGVAGLAPQQWGAPGDILVPADYDGDRRTDVAVWRPSNGYWYVKGGASVQWGQAGDIPVSGDYTGAGRAQVAVFRPSNGYWYVKDGPSIQWGQPGDIPVPADYDGDGTSDIAVFRPSNGYWYVYGGASLQWGQAGDIPVPADYSGDGKADLAVYRPSASAGGPWWYVRGVGSWTIGSVGDLPVPQDLDGDGQAELVVYRPSTGAYYSYFWSTNTWQTTTAAAGQVPVGLTVALRRGVSGDADRDRRRDPAVYRPSTGDWWLLKSGGGSQHVVWGGVAGDIAVPGDYDGDGLMDAAIYRPSAQTWFLRFSASGYTTFRAVQWGLSTDVPVVGDFDGDGKADIAVYRPSSGTWWLLFSASDYATYQVVTWGLINVDVPVVGDFDGDGKTDITVYRPSKGLWWSLPSSTGYTTYRTWTWGIAGDQAVAGDYDGDGVTDIAVYRPSAGAWWILFSSSGYLTSGSVRWGLAGTDVPIVGDFDGDGKADITVYRPLNGTWWALVSGTGYTFQYWQWGISGDIPVPPS